MSEQKPLDANASQNPPQSDDKSRREQRREGWRRGPMHGLFWGLLLILLGVLFFVQQQGHISDDSWWQYFLVGLGAIFILDALVHYLRRISYGIYGRLIAGAVLVVVGLAFLKGWDNWWPLVLIAAGVAILAGYFVRGSK
jgi:hypothetical protein